jgi:hypothetical protein
MKRSEMLGKIASVIINHNEVTCVINRDKAMEMADIEKEMNEMVDRINDDTEFNKAIDKLLNETGRDDEA